MPGMRTNIALLWAGGRKVLGAVCGGLPRMRAAVDAWLRRARRRRVPNRFGDGLRADRSNGAKLMPIRLPRQI